MGETNPYMSTGKAQWKTPEHFLLLVGFALTEDLIDGFSIQHRSLTYFSGELKFGTDESTFNAILVSRSFAQLKAIFEEYEQITSHAFEKAIKNEFSGDIEDGLMALGKTKKSFIHILIFLNL